MKISKQIVISFLIFALLAGCNAQPEKIYYPDGTLKIEYYAKGNKLYGPYKAYYPNGIIKIESIYEDDVRIYAKRYYENGNIKEIINYKNGIINDSAFFFYENGQLKQKVFYKDGKAEGLMIDYYENGNILSKIDMKGGKNNGRKTFYYQNGQVEQDGLIKDDSALYYIIYNADGKFDQEFRAVDVEPEKDTIYLGETYKANIKFYGLLPDGPSIISVIVDQKPIDNESSLGDEILSMGSTSAVFEYKPQRTGIYHYQIRGRFNHYVIPEKQISKGNIHTYNFKFVVLPKKTNKIS